MRLSSRDPGRAFPTAPHTAPSKIAGRAPVLENTDGLVGDGLRAAPAAALDSVPSVTGPPHVMRRPMLAVDDIAGSLPLHAA